MNIFKPVSDNKLGKVSFYTFEIIACVVLFIEFVLAIVDGANFSSFQAFLNGFLYGIIYFCIIYGIGRIIDLLSAKKCGCNNNDYGQQ